MVGDPMARDFAGGFSLGNSRVEVAPFIVAEKVLEVASQPILDATLGLLGMASKVVVRAWITSVFMLWSEPVSVDGSAFGSQAALGNILRS